MGVNKNIEQNTGTPGTHSVAIGNESDQEDSCPTQNSDKTVQTEQVRRQQSCSSRASLDSQRSISFFVEFDDCDINGNDSVFSGTLTTLYSMFSLKTLRILEKCRL